MRKMAAFTVGSDMFLMCVASMTSDHSDDSADVPETGGREPGPTGLAKKCI